MTLESRNARLSPVQTQCPRLLSRRSLGTVLLTRLLPPLKLNTSASWPTETTGPPGSSSVAWSSGYPQWQSDPWNNVSPDLNSWGIGNRSGSHNLIIGDQHWYAGFGNIVSGLHNRVDGWGEVVFGNYNQAANTGSIILGGTWQTQFKNYTTVLGRTVIQ